MTTQSCLDTKPQQHINLFNYMQAYYENTKYHQGKIILNKKYSDDNFSMLIKGHDLHKKALIMFASYFEHITDDNNLVQGDIDAACVEAIQQLQFNGKVFILLRVFRITSSGRLLSEHWVLLSFRKDDKLIWLTMYDPLPEANSPLKASLERFKDNQLHAEIDLTIHTHTGCERDNADCGVCIFEALRHYIQDPTTMPLDWTPLEIRQFRKAHMFMTEKAGRRMNRVAQNPKQVLLGVSESTLKRKGEIVDNKGKKIKFDDTNFVSIDAEMKTEKEDNVLALNEEIIKLTWSPFKPTNALQFNILVNSNSVCITHKIGFEQLISNGERNPKHYNMEPTMNKNVLLTEESMEITTKNTASTTIVFLNKSWDNTNCAKPLVSTTLENNESGSCVVVITPPEMTMTDEVPPSSTGASSPSSC